MTRRGLGRLRAGEWLVLLGAVLVVVSLFAPWYEGLLGQLVYPLVQDFKPAIAETAEAPV